MPSATTHFAPHARAPLPERLHTSVWRGNQMGRSAERALPSGFAALDAQLPGGGWPRRALSELLLPHPGLGEIRLLAPSLAATQQAGRLVMLFDPPAALSAWALMQMGLDAEQLLVIDTGTQGIPGVDGRPHEAGVDARLWALEQALHSGHVGAVLAWLPPRLRAERLRRLQVAAHAHDGPAFVLREMAVQQQASPAPLRLALQAGGADCLSVRVLKRRGPPLAQALLLELPPVLSASATRKARELAAQTVLSGQGAAAAPSLRAATFVNLA
ncbi:translesion DNA synthesis-associated protein ImuA [Rhizobacter sp. P5_C2]